MNRKLSTTTGAAAVAAALLALAACGGGNSLEDSDGSSGSNAGSGKGGKGAELVVGGADFTESKVLAEMYRLVLDKAGYKATVKSGLKRELYEPQLQKGALAVVPEYAATMAEFLNVKENGPKAKAVASPDAEKTMAALNKLAGPVGLRALAAGKAVDQNAFAVSKSFAAKHKLKTLSDLGKSGVEVTVAAGDECKVRPFCAPGLEKTYGIKVAGIDPKGVGSVASKKAVQRGTDQLVLTTTTDGTLSEFDLVALEDDKKLQNADNIVPVVNVKKADKPGITKPLEKLTQTLTTEDLAALNKKVDAERQKPSAVAEEYLKSKGLI
jgi:osmoprotectant transport system substrate-binding protein